MTVEWDMGFVNLDTCGYVTAGFWFLFNRQTWLTNSVTKTSSTRVTLAFDKNLFVMNFGLFFGLSFCVCRTHPCIRCRSLHFEPFLCRFCRFCRLFCSGCWFLFLFFSGVIFGSFHMVPSECPNPDSQMLVNHYGHLLGGCQQI